MIYNKHVEDMTHRIWPGCETEKCNKKVYCVNKLWVAVLILCSEADRLYMPPLPPTHTHPICKLTHGVTYTYHMGNQCVFLISLPHIRWSETLTSISPTLHLLSSWVWELSPTALLSKLKTPPPLWMPLKWGENVIVGRTEQDQNGVEEERRA